MLKIEVASCFYNVRNKYEQSILKILNGTDLIIRFAKNIGHSSIILTNNMIRVADDFKNHPVIVYTI